MRKLWGNVTGERMWYALHGYDIQAPASKRGMFGHGRVLPPDSRTISGASEITRLFLTKRRGGCAVKISMRPVFGFWLSIRDGSWMGKRVIAGRQ
ncbi:DNA polymerase Y subunit UmuC family protein [Brucella pseudogrignonensis]|uniref:hypothetical protein n=1 Tax=Brucella pseudogrignonensis TaxID=419475 RepID=UPI001F158FE0|nr:hypothetical protein [Brucella pseudogrignonensis]